MLRPSAQQAAARQSRGAARCRHAVLTPAARPCRPVKAVSEIAFEANASAVPAAVVHVLPKPEPVSKIVAAQAAAEAAHQELMSSGRLAEAAAKNELLSSILTTYSTVQRLYHKALKPFMDLHPQYASSPAGLAYAICCDVLELKPDKQPGDSIEHGELELLCQAAVDACRPGQESTCDLADALIKVAALEVTGPWHTLPDLLTCLSIGQFENQDSSEVNLPDDILDGLSEVAGKAALGSVKSFADKSLDKPCQEYLEDLLISSCALPEDPIIIVQQDSGQPLTVMGLLTLVERGRLFFNNLYGTAVEVALCTLPECDHPAAIQAEVESSSWAHYVHAHPEQSRLTLRAINRLLDDLRLIVVTAAFSHFAYHTVLDHVGGRLPMDDWEQLETASMLCEMNPAFRATKTDKWAVTQLMIAQLAQATAALSSGNAGDVKKAEYFTDKMDTAEGGGDAALDGLMKGVMPALRCAIVLTSQSFVSILPMLGSASTSRVLRAAVIARGSRQLAAEVEALGEPTAATAAQALTAFAAGAANTSSSTKSKANTHQGNRAQKQPFAAAAGASSGQLSVQDAADQLYQQLMQPGSKLTRQAVAKLLCAAGSPGDMPRAYQPALTDALSNQLEALATDSGKPECVSPWLAGAVLQHHMYAVADKRPDLATLLLGPGAPEEVYIRSVAEFMEAKRQTAAAFTEAVCRVGWSLTSQAAAALALSWVLALCNAPDVRLRGHLWAVASLLAGGVAAWQGNEGGIETKGLAPGPLLATGFAQTTFMALNNDGLASSLPPAFTLFNNMLRDCEGCMRFAADNDKINTVWAARKLYHTIMLIFKESGGSFSASKSPWARPGWSSGAKQLQLIQPPSDCR